MNMKMLRANAAVLPLQCPPSPNSQLLLFSKTRSSFTSFSYGSLPIKQKLPKSFITNTAVKCSASDNGAGALGEDLRQQYQEEEKGRGNFWEKWKSSTAEMSGKLAKLGLAAVLAYGLFDGVTYTTFFVLAFLGYEKSTGKNPAANLQALLGIIVLMWTGNNVTRPFRVAGAAALAPAIDKGLRRIQKAFNFPNLVYSFALVVSVIATLCLTVVGLLILSRWGK